MGRLAGGLLVCWLFAILYNICGSYSALPFYKTNSDLSRKVGSIPLPARTAGLPYPYKYSC